MRYARRCVAALHNIHLWADITFALWTTDLVIPHSAEPVMGP